MKHKLFLLFILLIAAPSLVSCDLLFSSPVREVRGDGNFRLELWVSQERASVGDSIDIVFTVKNIGDETEIIEIDDEPVMDIIVRQGFNYEREVCWSDGREITPEMRRLELAPGESKTIEMTWVPIGSSDAQVAGIVLKKTPRGERDMIRVYFEICIGACDWLI